jgi:hypothetical protein
MIAAVSGGLYDDSAACAARWGGQQGDMGVRPALARIYDRFVSELSKPL